MKVQLFTMHHRFMLLAIVLLAFAGTPSAQDSGDMAYDHVHLLAPDPQQAYAWYVQHLNGRQAEFPGRVAFSAWPERPPLPVQVLFTRAIAPLPNEGGSIACIAFSFADLAGAMQTLQAAAVRIVEPLQTPGGRWKRAVIEDPWGTRIELVEDRALTGFHHVLLRVPDVDATLTWYIRAFGGARTRLDSRLDAVKYGNMYVAAVAGRGAPSRGRAIDHISWGPTDIEATVDRLRSSGTKITAAVSGPNGFGHHTAFVEDPDGVAIELVQHDEFLRRIP